MYVHCQMYTCTCLNVCRAEHAHSRHAVCGVEHASTAGTWGVRGTCQCKKGLDWLGGRGQQMPNNGDR